MNLNSRQLKILIKNALKEDIGKADITTRLIIPCGKKVKAVIITKESGVVCGIDIAGLVFKTMGKNTEFKPLVSDGDNIRKGKILARVYGEVSSILTAERVVLNLLSMLSGIATTTRCFVNKIKPYKVKILDTRKTLPGLRRLEKYAVNVGGGCNHRMKLDEMIMVKDNHLKALRTKHNRLSIKEIIEILKKGRRKNIKIEVEVKSLIEFKEALKGKPDIIMLDNMNMNQVKKAVKMRKGLRPKIEVSGNIALNTVKKYAGCGVDFISVGSLTKDIKSLDISLDIL